MTLGTTLAQSLSTFATAGHVAGLLVALGVEVLEVLEKRAGGGRKERFVGD